MNPLTVLWSMLVGAGLVSGAVHALVWLRSREARASLCFALIAAGVSAMAALELWMLHSTSAAQYGERLRWFHLPVWVTVLALLGFARAYLGGGRTWLAWGAGLARTLSLALNFLHPVNTNYRSIEGLRTVRFLGADVPVPIGEPNPAMLVGQLSLFLLLAFVLDCARSAWQRGEQRRALTVGGSVAFFVGAATLQAILVFWGFVDIPVTASLFFAASVAGMGFELSSDLLRSATLARELQQRADELARERLELAHLARVASLSELSGSLAHELNQPLAIILANAQAAQRLLERAPPDLDEVRAILDDIVAADRRAGEVIRRLRGLLKRGESERRPLALQEVAESVLTLMRSELIGRGVELERRFAPELPPVLGDRVPLEQVLLNLVLNACDALATAPLGSRRIRLTSASSDGLVRLSLADNGTGLPADPARLFEPFFTTKPGGLGMGLSICRTIVTAHGGRLWAEPVSTGGSVFHLELPAARP